MRIEETVEALQIMPLSNLQSLSEVQIEGAVDVYQSAFARPPYQEAFTDEEAIEALQYILDMGGDLLVGKSENAVVSLAGGYMKEDGSYYIEELAVNPALQGLGIGRLTIIALVKEALNREPSALEIRTTTRNDMAISLYSSEGFAIQDTSEVVAQARQDGKLALDERVYLRREIKEETMSKPTILKRAAIVYPSGNTTAVVFDQMLKTNREQLNNNVMESWRRKAVGEPEVEQCCFVTLPKDERALAKVEMFGGEFCGNATRSVIQLLTKGKDYQGMIEVSGVDRPLNFSVKNGVIGLEMPLPEDGELVKIVEEGTLVQLDGIAQLVVTDLAKRENSSPRGLLNILLSQNKYDLAEQAAVGITYYDPVSNKADFGVWVKEVNTVFDETACGSGTCAIGIATALQAQENQKLEVIQPSGESIETEAYFNGETGKVTTSTISGTVSVLYDGAFELS